MNLSEKITENVKALRLKLGLSQSELAKRSGLTVRYISRLENSPQNITIDVLEKFAQGLNCDISTLISEEGTSLKDMEYDAEALEHTIQLLESIRSRLI